LNCAAGEESLGRNEQGIRPLTSKTSKGWESVIERRQFSVYQQVVMI
jgi:hypothetical protein